MTDQESQSLSEFEQREDRLYNNRMLIVMKEIEVYDEETVALQLEQLYGYDEL